MVPRTDFGRLLETMMQSRFVVLFFVATIGCADWRHLEQEQSFDRSSPSATFAVFQQGVENKKFLQVIQSYSEQQKRFALFETLFAGGMSQNDEYDEHLLNHGIDMDAFGESVTDANDLVTKVLSKIADLDQFLADANKIFDADARPSIRPDILDVSLDGNRAKVSFNVVLYSYSKPAGENAVTTENSSTHEQTAFMRKFGDKWLICPEGEWHDATFKWTVPQ